MERINGTTLAGLDTTGKAKRTRKTKTEPTAPGRLAWLVVVSGWDWQTIVRVVMTVSLGVGIPLLSLALSKMAGTLAAHAREEETETALRYGLAGFALGLMVAVLAVSLNHLAWSIGNITRSSKRASWSLAVALDLSLVLCEGVAVYASRLDLSWVAYTVMVCVAVASMALNVWAFLMHE